MTAQFNKQTAIISTPLFGDQKLVSVIYIISTVLLLIFQKAL
jgi:hypothetical protein